jgi:hypothetical protein
MRASAIGLILLLSLSASGQTIVFRVPRDLRGQWVSAGTHSIYIELG